MESKKFFRKKEDFKCRMCEAIVKGSGYTNHCPNCLWGRHIDINPGDRKELCRGMMEPVRIESKSGGYVITHRCEKCHILRRNKAGEIDDIEKIIELAGVSHEK